MRLSPDRARAPRLVFLLAAAILAPVLPGTRKAAADPLTLPPPLLFDAGPLGSLQAQGIFSGLGTWQDNPTALDASNRFDITNAQLILQKNTGPVQFFLQAGAYNFPTLGVPASPTSDIGKNFYGPVPEAYVKFVPAGDFSIEVGKLPTLMGAETTWTWMNFNIERGLLWNLENAVTRGAQLNYGAGSFHASLAWTDGYYSNRYNTISGSLAYAPNTENTLSVFFYDNLGHTPYGSTANPEALNNGRTYNLIYTYSSASWIVSPYLQYIVSPASTQLGYAHANDSFGAAVLADYSFTRTFSLGARFEYITSSGADNVSANNNLLGYGPGSRAWTFTLTPTWQAGGLFARAEISYVRVTHYASGMVFGLAGNNRDQIRALVETGVMF